MQIQSCLAWRFLVHMARELSSPSCVVHGRGKEFLARYPAGLTGKYPWECWGSRDSPILAFVQQKKVSCFFDSAHHEEEDLEFKLTTH